MATWGPSTPHQDVATRVDTAIAAGAGDHLPIGDYGSADYRSAIRFSSPSWGAWTAITKATLKFYISDFQHVGPKNSSIYCSRMNMPVWTKDQGTQDCESGFAGANTTQAGDIVSVSTNRISFSSGSTANAAKSLDVTAMVQYYKAAGASYCVFVFDNNGADQYTELWSLGKAGTTYDATLTIDYETASAPNAPTLTAPVASAVIVDTKPVFSWVHSDPQGDAQSQANVQLYDAGGVAIGSPVNVAGSTASLTWPTDLTRGTTYQWAVQTADAVSGFGVYSAKRSFSIKSLPVVTIDATRYMEFYNGQPRLRVKWSTSQPQTQYQVTVGAYDSGIQPTNDHEHLLTTLDLVSGTPISVTVKVWNDDISPTLTGTATQSFTPRYGLTTHRRDLTSIPIGWGVPSALTTIPPGASLIFEYGSNTSAAAAPTAWYSTLSAVPLAQWLFYRTWFLPSSTQGPTLDYVNIPTDATASFVDKWGTTRDAPGLAAPWAVSANEYVYGSRSLWAKVTGAGPYYAYAYKVAVKQDRSYILTGLMQSLGNSGACLELQDVAGNVLLGGGVVYAPDTPMRTEILTANRPWFTTDGRDVNRYKTPIWKATANMDVYVVLRVGGTAGSQAWFDAVKLEESTVATPWSPGAVGATVVDAGGVQVDAYRGGIFRLRGTDGAPRSIVESGAKGLTLGGDTEITSPSTGILAVNGAPVGGVFVGNSPPAVPGNGQLWWDDDDASTGVVGYGMGTSFPVSPALYDRFFRTDHLAEYVWNGSAWVDMVTKIAGPAYFLQRGQLSMNVATGGGVVQATVTWPVPFSAIPIVGAWASASAGNKAYTTFQSLSITSMDLGLTAATAFNYAVFWWAWGPR